MLLFEVGSGKWGRYKQAVIAEIPVVNTGWLRVRFDWLRTPQADGR
jgi:hypothetical protein